MATLVAVGPVALENVDLAKIISVPLVSFVKKESMVVTLNEEDVTLTYNTSDLTYKGKVGLYN